MSIMTTDCPIMAVLLSGQYVCKVLRHADLKVIQLRPVYWSSLFHSKGNTHPFDQI